MQRRLSARVRSDRHHELGPCFTVLLRFGVAIQIPIRHGLE